MDKLNLLKIARDSCVALNRQEDGSYLLFSTTKLFADRIESAVAHEYEQKRKKDVLALVALRSEVAMLAKDNERLREIINDARILLKDVDYV